MEHTFQRRVREKDNKAKSFNKIHNVSEGGKYYGGKISE